MITRIDHVILAGPDLDALEAAFTQLGFHVTGGGEHPHLSTRNRIIVLDEGYIELLSIADPDRASPYLRQFIADGGGWVGYALQSDDIEADTAAMRARGVDARGPTPGRLVAPDGSARSWRVTMTGTDDLWQAAFPLPFLIQHDATGDEHRAQLSGAGGLAPHPNGGSAIAHIAYTTRDAAALYQRFKSAYDLPGELHQSQDEGQETATGHVDLPGRELILIGQPANPDATPGVARRGVTITVRVRVTDLADAEALHWPAIEGHTNTERFLVIPLPGISASIEMIAPR